MQSLAEETLDPHEEVPGASSALIAESWSANVEAIERLCDARLSPIRVIVDGDVDALDDTPLRLPRSPGQLIAELTNLVGEG
jgi:hypothetical protein